MHGDRSADVFLSELCFVALEMRTNVSTEWDSKEEDQTDNKQWEDNWDDDNLDDDFSKQLRYAMIGSTPVSDVCDVIGRSWRRQAQCPLE